MKILDSNNINFDQKLDSLLLKRKNKIQSSSVSVVNIIKDVKKNGDKALLKYEKRFNQNSLIIPTSKQIAKSILSLDKKVKRAIDLAYNRIYKFHSFQKFKNISYIDKLKNRLEYKYLPIESVGIYVPGSTVSYPSTVLMNAVPAIIAGVKRIIMMNPGFKGKQNPAVLYAAHKCKIKEIYSIGGASAIAAAAYGTILISKDKKLIEKIKVETLNQLKETSRLSIAQKSLMNNGILIHISSDKKIIDVVNKIAPEHLELNVKNYKSFIPKIKNSGSICLGKYAVMAMTDYNIGSNHILPTNGSAKYSSGVSVNEFYKRISYINLSKKGIESLGPSVITLANYEGLAAHAQSIKKRLKGK